MKLTELFDNPVEPSRQVSDSYGDTVHFTVNGIQYEVLISTFGHGAWDVSFDAQITPGDRVDHATGDRVDHATGTGNEVAVFSTVNSVVSKFLQHSLSRVHTLAFTSDLESRTRLYRRIALKWAKEFGLDLQMGPDQWGDHEFVLTNPAYQA